MHNKREIDLMIPITLRTLPPWHTGTPHKKVRNRPSERTTRKAFWRKMAANAYRHQHTLELRLRHAGTSWRDVEKYSMTMAIPVMRAAEQLLSNAEQERCAA